MDQLVERIQALGIPRSAVVVDESVRDECYALVEQGPDDWVVFYSERGLRTAERHFADRSSAEDYFIRWLRRDFEIDV